MFGCVPAVVASDWSVLVTYTVNQIVTGAIWSM